MSSRRKLERAHGGRLTSGADVLPGDPQGIDQPVDDRVGQLLLEAVEAVMERSVVQLSTLPNRIYGVSTVEMEPGQAFRWHTPSGDRTRHRASGHNRARPVQF